MLDQININKRILSIKEKINNCHHQLAAFDADLSDFVLEVSKLMEEVSANGGIENYKELFSLEIMRHILGIGTRLSQIITDTKYLSMFYQFDSNSRLFFGSSLLNQLVKLNEKIKLEHGLFSCGCEKCKDHSSNILSRGRMLENISKNKTDLTKN